MISDVVRFREELDKANPWWKGGKVPELENRNLIERGLSGLITEEMGTKRGIIITGPRRAGKTILMKQTIRKLLEKTETRNMLYYSLDDPTLSLFSDSPVKDVLDYFLENIAKTGRKFIFLDEVQSAKDWYKWVKSFYDSHDDIKFFLSGSSSLALQREANQYLRGRTIDFELFQLSFAEFLELHGIKTRVAHSMEDYEKIPGMDFIEMKKLHGKVKEKFNEYLLVGGFPEWSEIRNPERWFMRLVNDIPKKAIYEDIARLFEIKNPKALESVLAFIAANQSRILSYEKISDVVHVDRNTIVNYLEYLKASYIIIEVLKHAGVKEQIKAMKKFLVADQGVRNAILKDYEIRENNIGFIIENVIGVSLFFYCKRRGASLTYLKQNGEIDFIVKNKCEIPIEVKYKQKIGEKEIHHLSSFIDKNRLPSGIVVTKDILQKKGKIIYIPCWLFLLMLSNEA